MRIGILRRARGTIDDRHRGAVIDAELALEAGTRGLLAGELEHERMHPELDDLDRRGGESRFGA